MKVVQLVKEYFFFNRAEQRGILVMLVILALLFLAGYFFPGFRSRPEMDYSAYEMEIRAFEAKMVRMDSIEKAARNQPRQKNSGFTAWSGADLGRSFVQEQRKIMIELNSADTFDLQQLRGIGPAFARRIVNYRGRLHGFYEKTQLLEVFGMDPGRYKMICDQVWVRPDSVHPMDLNTVTFKQLLSHPYFPFEITKNIMTYRRDHKQFKSLEEVKEIAGITDSVFRRIRVYLEVR